jgi:hypothetical protein
MDRNLEIPLHIAASDFDDHWQGSAASGHGYVPLRMEFKPIGVIKTSAAGEGKVDLCWSSDDGRRLNQQSITLSGFKTDGQDHVCLGCPGCGRPRKHLFLVAVPSRGRSDDCTNGFAFVCKKCSGIDTTKNRKSWRQKRHPKNRKNGAFARLVTNETGP